MVGGDRRVFGARMSLLPETAGFVEAFCARHRITRDDAMRLALIVEELFTNTVVHGYRGESDAPIVMVLSARDDDVVILDEDAAPRFDPLSVPPVDVSTPIESRPIGDLGVHLVRQFAGTARYVREDVRNQLWLSVRCEGLERAVRTIARR